MWQESIPEQRRRMPMPWDEQNAIRPDKVAIYVRWSTDDQAKGTTLQVQLNACHHYMLSQGWKPRKALTFIDDGYSGSTLDRPGMNKLRHAVKLGLVDCVIVYKLDRLARNVVDAVDLVLKEWQDLTHIKSVCEPIDTTTAVGRQVFVMLTGFADWERATIRDRLMSGKIALVKKGKDPGGLRPYGYVKGDEPNTFAIEPNEAAVVRRMFEMYAEGSSFNQIARTLNTEGIVTRRGKEWTAPSVRCILTNPKYVGYMVYGKYPVSVRKPQKQKKSVQQPGKVYKVKSPYIPPIIDEELYYKVQEIRQSAAEQYSRQRTKKPLRNSSLLGGIAQCKCGRYMSVSHMKANGREYMYYRCSRSAQQHDATCDCLGMNMEEIDHLVVEEIRSALSTRDAQESLIDGVNATRQIRIDQITSQKDELKKQLADMQTRFEQTSNDYITGKIPTIAYTAAANMLEAESTRIVNAINVLERESNALTNQIGLMQDASEIARQFAQWADLSLIDKRKVILDATTEIILYKSPDKRQEISISYAWEAREEANDHDIA